MPTTPADAYKAIKDIMSRDRSPNFGVIAWTRDGGKQGIYGWLGLSEDIIDAVDRLAKALGKPTCKDKFTDVIDVSVGYYTGQADTGQDVYDESNLQSLLNNHTFRAESAVDALRISAVAEVQNAISEFQSKFIDIVIAYEERLGQDKELSEAEGEAVKAAAEAVGLGSNVYDLSRKLQERLAEVELHRGQLQEEIKVIAGVVKQQVEESRSLATQGHFTAATGASSAVAPPSHQAGGPGYKAVWCKYPFEEQDLKWSFGVRCVNEDESLYVLPSSPGIEGRHWRIDKDEPILVENEIGVKSSKASDNYAPNKNENNFEDPAAFVKGVLDSWRPPDGGWYRRPSRGAIPHTHQKGGRGYKDWEDFERGEHKWTFAVRAVDETGQKYVLPGTSTFHHWQLEQGDKVKVRDKHASSRVKESELDGDVTIDSSVTDPGDSEAAAAIDKLLAVSPDKWFPPTTDTTTTDGGGSTEHQPDPVVEEPVERHEDTIERPAGPRQRQGSFGQSEIQQNYGRRLNDKIEYTVVDGDTFESILTAHPEVEQGMGIVKKLNPHLEVDERYPEVKWRWLWPDETVYLMRKR